MGERIEMKEAGENIFGMVIVLIDPGLGRRKGWLVLTQAALALATAAMMLHD